MTFDISMIDGPVKCRSQKTQTPFRFETIDEAIAAAKSNPNDFELYYHLDRDHFGAAWTGADWKIRCLYSRDCMVDPCRTCFEVPCMC